MTGPRYFAVASVDSSRQSRRQRRSIAARLDLVYDRFSDAARAAVARAEAEAYARGIHQVEPEDLVVALAGHSGVAGSVLRAVAADPALLREGVAATSVPVAVDPARVRPLPLAESTATAFTIAVREADGFRQGYVGTEHLLLGLLREPTGRATALLLAIRRDPGMVRERILDLVSSPGFISPEAPVVEVPIAIVPDVDVPDHRSRLAGVDRVLIENLLEEVVKLRAEIGRLRAEVALGVVRDGRHIA